MADTDMYAGDSSTIFRYLLRHERPWSTLSDEILSSAIIPTSARGAYAATDAVYDAIVIASQHYEAQTTTPLIIETVHTRHGALHYAAHVEQILRRRRDHTPYTVEWWCRPLADGRSGRALFCLGFIGLEALVGLE